jgi:hypothetical protein
MRCCACGFEVKESWGSVRLQCFMAYGYASIYVNLLHRDLDFGAQVGRIRKLRDRMMRLEKSDHAVRISRRTGRKRGRMSTAQQWRTLLRDIRDETENMC